MLKTKSLRVFKKKRFFLIAIVLVIIGIIFYIWFISNYTLCVVNYSVTSDKISESFRIAQLTDLHGYKFGKNNENLIELVKEQQPDIIVMTGDMLNRDDDDDDICSLISGLIEIAPVYFSLGNHEDEYEYDGKDCADLTADVETAGAVVLEQEYIDLDINGNAVRIGGLYGYVLSEPTSWMDGSEQEFMHEFEDMDSYKILLSHKSEGLLLWDSMNTYDVDLIFSGHIHGGEIILPFIGGIYTPEEGFFPQYTYGMFEKGNSIMILSSGLGTSGIPGYGFKTRWNNIPEVVVTDVSR